MMSKRVLKISDSTPAKRQNDRVASWKKYVMGLESRLNKLSLSTSAQQMKAINLRDNINACYSKIKDLQKTIPWKSKDAKFVAATIQTIKWEIAKFAGEINNNE